MATLRRPEHEDRARILALLHEVETAQAGAPISDMADVDDLLGFPGLDLVDRARIQVDGPLATAFVALHPAPQPGELRAQLIVAPVAEPETARLLGLVGEWSRDDAPGAAPVTTTLFLVPGSPGRRALEDDGWQIVHSYTRMYARLDAERPVHLPDGVTIRAAGTPADLETVHAVLEDAIAGHWKHRRRTFAEFLDDQEARAGHDPTLWLLAETDGVPAGAVIARDPADRAWIAWLGVDPSRRGRGIAGALLRTVFDELGRRGHLRVGVDVDTHNQTDANAVYERVGMTVVGRADQWSRTYPGRPA